MIFVLSYFWFVEQKYIHLIIIFEHQVDKKDGIHL